MNKDNPVAGKKFADTEAGTGKRLPTRIVSALSSAGAACISYIKRKTASAGADRSLLLRSLLFGAAAFLLGRAELFFGMRTLGLSLLCAAPWGVPAILTGLLASAATVGGAEGGVLCAAYIGAAGLRLAGRCLIDPPEGGQSIIRTAFGENVYLRMATSATAAFAVGLYNIISGGFYYYDLLGAVFAMICAPVAVFLYRPLFETAPDDKSEAADASALLDDAAYIALLVSFCAALRTDSVFGIGLCHAAACACTLFAVKERGMLRGAVAGLLCGAVAGWMYAPLYAVAALAAGLLIKVSVLAGATAVPVCGALWCAIFGGAGDFLMMFPSELCGLIVFCGGSLIRERIEGSAVRRSAAAAESAYAVTGAGAALRDYRGRMSELSDAFGTLAASFGDLSRTRRRPSLAELRQVCDEACDAFCPGCANRALCWDLEYASTLDMLCKISSSVYRDGKIEVDALPDYLRRRCGALPAIASRINTNSALLIRRALTDERLSVFAADYRAMSNVLKDALTRNRREYEPDHERTAAVCECLRQAGIRCSGVTVAGRRRVSITVSAADLTRCRCGADELKHMLETAVGMPLTSPSFLPGGSRAVMELSARRRFAVSFSAARSAPDGNFTGCGDTVCRAESNDDYFYAVICDGMGTGNEAAFASGVCGLFLRSMLSSSLGVETALSMLNAVLRADAGECSVSVDLLAVDLLNGSAALYKSGAAPTYLRRGSRIFPLESPSAPIGILRELETVRSDFSVCDGDVLLMTSDGAITDDETGAQRGSVWLLDLLEGCDTGAPGGGDEAVRHILRSARTAGSRDDISAAIISVSELK